MEIMKKLLITGLLIGIAFFAQPHMSFAQMGMMGNYYNTDSSASSSVSQAEKQNQQKLQRMINDLLKSQNVFSVNQLNCQKIGNDTLEKLGDAWMDVIIPDVATHQNMDNMMGGDGSQSLTNAHIGMAERYLGCQTNGSNNNYSWMPMFGRQNVTAGGGGFPMMGGYGYNGMMGWNGRAGAFGTLVFIGWLVVLIDLILVGVFLWKQIRKK